MTVATDLQRAKGIRRALNVRIDGHKHELWQRSEIAGPPAFSQDSIDEFTGAFNWTYEEGSDPFNRKSATNSGGKLRIHCDANGSIAWSSSDNSGIICSSTNLPANTDKMRFTTQISEHACFNDVGVCLSLQTGYQNAYNLAVSLSGGIYYIYTWQAIANLFSVNGASTISNPNAFPIQLRTTWDVVTGALTCEYRQASLTWTTLRTDTVAFTPTRIALCMERPTTPTGSSDVAFDYMLFERERLTLTCLQAPQEMSTDLNLGTMTTSLSAITFELDDIDDPDDAGKSYFGKLLAPARWLDNAHTYVVQGTGYHDVVDADATTIPVEDVTALDISGGTAYMGHETLSYELITANGLENCIKGLYPCVGDVDADTYGYTYERPLGSSSAAKISVGEVPFSWLGRRIALYVTTWNAGLQEWNDRSQDVLLWCGRISDKIVYRPSKRQWQLSCSSLVEDLNRSIGGLFRSVKLRPDTYNLSHSGGYLLRLSTHIRTADPYPDIESTEDFILPSGIYTLESLMNELNLMSLTVFKNNGTPIVDFYLFSIDWSLSGDGKLVCWTQPHMSALWLKIYDTTGEVFKALGMPEILEFEYRWNGTHYISQESVTSQSYTTAYHSLNHYYNGGYLYVDDASKLWNNQGDDTSQAGYVQLSGVMDAFEQKTTIWKRYTAVDIANNRLTIDPVYRPVHGYAADRFGADESVSIQQVYIPVQLSADGSRRYGPFEQLLFPLLSTGTPGYNHATYDALPLSLSLAMQSTLVHIQSFLNADSIIKSNPLAIRDIYVIQEPIPYMDMLQRECRLFGFAPIWRYGKLEIVNVLALETRGSPIQIDESVRARPVEMPDMDIGVDTVVNQYECKVSYDYNTGKWGPPIIITDVDSTVGLMSTRAVKIEHPALGQGTNAGNIRSLLENALRGRILRFPSPVVAVTLAHTLINRVHVGDVIRYIDTTTVDPTGSGLLNTNVLALVLSVAWNYQTWTGNATLMLLPVHGDFSRSWGPSAIVDYSQAGGGWDSVNKYLYLVNITFGSASTDSADGDAFSAGDYIYIIERAPQDPLNVQKWGPLQIASDYETNGAGILTLVGGTTLSGFVPGREYLVTYAPYNEASASQQGGSAYYADPVTRLIADAISALRWG